jgi:Predicted exonuclease of the beta-lactamase fold involved in RNA processing
VRIEGDDRTYLCTGDVSVRDRSYLSGFDPVPADVLVIEATYGRPGYVFPDQDELERRIVEWLNETVDRPVLLFGYALGRAQKLQRLVARSDRSRLLVSEAIADLNAAIESHMDVTFDAEEYDDLDPGPGEAVVLPNGSARLDFVERLAEETDALTAGFSGWALEDSFKYRGGYDEAFVLSDHADFSELVGIVEAVDPDQVYTQHGFADDLARHLTSEGFDAQALKQDQTSLGQF